MCFSEREVARLSDRPEVQTLRIFKRMTDAMNCIDCLLTAEARKHSNVLDKLRNARQYAIPLSRTGLAIENRH